MNNPTLTRTRRTVCTVLAAAAPAKRPLAHAQCRL